MLCPICLFAMQPFWSKCIIYGDIFLTHDARAFGYKFLCDYS